MAFSIWQRHELFLRLLINIFWSVSKIIGTYFLRRRPVVCSPRCHVVDQLIYWWYRPIDPWLERILSLDGAFSAADTDLALFLRISIHIKWIIREHWRHGISAKKLSSVLNFASCRPNANFKSPVKCFLYVQMHNKLTDWLPRSFTRLHRSSSFSSCPWNWEERTFNPQMNDCCSPLMSWRQPFCFCSGASYPTFYSSRILIGQWQAFPLHTNETQWFNIHPSKCFPYAGVWWILILWISCLSSTFLNTKTTKCSMHCKWY